MNLKVEDYYPSGKRFLLRFKEKGGKEKELPVHHKLEELLDQYLKASGLEKEPQSPLFPAAVGKTGKLSRRPLVRTDAADMLKRRLKQAGLPAHYSGARNSFGIFRSMRRNGVGSSKPQDRTNAPSICRTTSSARSLAVRREIPASRASPSRPSTQTEKVDRNCRW